MIDQMVDRIYQQAPNTVQLNDKQRKISITSSGHDSCVIWNPWKEGAAKMGDLPDNAYQKFVCIEAANTDQNGLILQPGEEHIITAEYQA